MKSLNRARNFVGVVAGALVVVAAAVSPSSAATVGGGADPAFTPPSLNSFVAAGLPVAGGKTLLGGFFTDADGVTGQSYLIRLNADGSLDTTFTPPSLNSGVWSLAPLANGKFLVGGGFTSANANTDARYLIRIFADGTLDTTFIPAGTKPNLNAPPYAMLELNDRSVIVGGGFTQAYGSTDNAYLIRVTSEGELSDSWSPPGLPWRTTAVRAVTQLASGDVMVGGDQTAVAGQNNTLVRVTTGGSIVSRVEVGGDGGASAGDVLALHRLNDGSVMVGGDFASLDGDSQFKKVARLNGNGSLDTSFVASAVFPAFSNISAIALTAGGEFLVGGFFDRVNGDPTFAYLAQLTSDGSLDESFVPLSLNEQVRYISPPSNGTAVVAGFFTDADGISTLDRVARIFVPEPESTSSEAPRAPIQQYAIDEDATCEALLPDESDFPALLSLKTEAWGKSWAWWPNEGTGGFVCTRQPYYTAGGNWAVR